MRGSAPKSAEGEPPLRPPNASMTDRVGNHTGAGCAPDTAAQVIEHLSVLAAHGAHRVQA
jgi:hypothetical protein